MRAASPDTQPILQVAAKAAIVNGKGEVLIVREAVGGGHNTKAGQWGLVGGRLEPGERFIDALEREVREETGLSITPGRPLYVGEWRPVIGGVTHQIIALFMYCTAHDQTVQVSDEHDRFQWIKPADRHHYPMMEPDCYVVDLLK